MRVSRAIQHYEDNKKRHAFEQANERLTACLQQMKVGLVTSITAIRMRDEYTYEHALRVVECARSIAENLGVGEETMAELAAAALLHDLGVIGTSDEILKAQRPLTQAEPNSGQSQTQKGIHILAAIPELLDVADIARCQHEDYDGTGHPIGLIGEQVPLMSRIVRVADEYDLLTKPKDLSQTLGHQDAINLLLHRAGKLDERVVKNTGKPGNETRKSG